MTETTHAPDLRSQLFAAQEWYASLVEGVDDARLGAATGCAEFDVRALQTHMTTVFDKIVGLATDKRDPYAAEGGMTDDDAEQMRERLAGERIDGVAPTERAAWLRGRIDEARDAWTDEVLDEPIQVGWGPVMPGRVVRPSISWRSSPTAGT
ncbi:maleylpyruvate isomerase N-terminal domain-containing protein [Mobilicoccus massiliensis]|uniref:maleylpyruvate isomerase N-terminal domain-containing protein n=1 Tax=Mobilicoccus massiliensis TaxID=1522310 RepID=UPI0006933218|nr:maleylpyruvate isomerase N-terminal domain-containing protein [Mobilicoccus massiliensis]